jgi:ketosteroid isomerase-like protein
MPGWGRAAGLIEVGCTAGSLTPDAVADRLLIAETLNRYGWSYDERDLGAIERVLAPDAVWEAVVAGSGSSGEYVGRDAILAWFREDMDSAVPLRRHHIGNVVFVSQDERSARVNAYLTLHELTDGVLRVLSTGFYRFDLVKRDGIWAFSRVLAGFDSF